MFDGNTTQTIKSNIMLESLKRIFYKSMVIKRNNYAETRLLIKFSGESIDFFFFSLTLRKCQAWFLAKPRLAWNLNFLERTNNHASWYPY